MARRQERPPGRQQNFHPARRSNPVTRLTRSPPAVGFLRRVASLTRGVCGGPRKSPIGRHSHFEYPRGGRMPSRREGIGILSPLMRRHRLPSPHTAPPGPCGTTSAAPDRTPRKPPPGSPPSNAPGRIATSARSPGGDTTASSTSAPPSPAGAPSPDVDAAIVRAAALRRMLRRPEQLPLPQRRVHLGQRRRAEPNARRPPRSRTDRDRARERVGDVQASCQAAAAVPARSQPFGDAGMCPDGDATDRDGEFIPSRRRRRRTHAATPAPCGDAESSASRSASSISIPQDASHDGPPGPSTSGPAVQTGNLPHVSRHPTRARPIGVTLFGSESSRAFRSSRG